MLKVLRGMSLGDRVMGWVASLYKEPRAWVKGNVVLSDFFIILNGIRQGCPLSLLLFALVLEPFFAKGKE